MATKKQLLIGCFVVGCLLFLGTIGTFLIYSLYSARQQADDFDKWARERQLKRTSEAVGTITGYKETRSGNSYHHNVTFEFEVNGQIHTKTHLVPNGHPVTYADGKKGQVCYEQEDLTNASFSLKARVCGQ